jgi:DNA polymerase III alpha subunit
MGFYAPAQIVRDLREHGVEVRPVDINASYWDNVMEPDGRGGLALRLGFRQVKGLRADDAAWIAAARGNGYGCVADVWRRAGLPPRQIHALAGAEAFASVGLGRREALWEARTLTAPAPLPLFAGDIDGEGIVEAPPRLPAMSPGEAVVEDYLSLRLTLRDHPLAFLRPILTPGWAVAAHPAPVRGRAGPSAAPPP